MSFSTSAAVSASSTSVRPTRPLLSTLFRLPAALLPCVCSFLTPRELLNSLARTSHSTRDLLSPACFSAHALCLGAEELSFLSSRRASHFTTLQPFHARVLSDCCLDVDNRTAAVGIEQLPGTLDHFPALRSFALRDNLNEPLTDADLFDLLQHKSVLSCQELAVNGFTRVRPKAVPMDEEPWQSSTPLGRKRQRDGARKRVPDSWADLRLPAMTRFRLHVAGKSLYTGGAAFLTAHAGLLELDISTLLVSVSELTAVFLASTLPRLTSLTVWDHIETIWDGSIWAGNKRAYDLAPLVAALATTVVGVGGRLRPIQTLSFQLPATNEFLAVAAVITGLTSLENNPMRSGDWLEEWTHSPEMLAAFPLLQQLSVRTEPEVRDEPGKVTNMFPFLQQMASRPLRQLSIHTDGRVTFDAAAMAQLAGWCQLRELTITRSSYGESDCVNGTAPGSLTPHTAKSFPFLRVLTLRKLRMSAESVIAIAAAAPLLARLELTPIVPSCHPAVLCAIIAGFCEHIEDVSVGDCHPHQWSASCAADITAAYQSAVAAAGRGEGYRPCTRLRRICVDMCWCTPPSVWHALLSLLRWATSLSAVTLLPSNDPLVVSALSYLSSVKVLGVKCLWPESFMALMEQRDERTGRSRYHTSHGLRRNARAFWKEVKVAFMAVECDVDEEKGLKLRSHSAVIDAFRRTLSDEHQAMLERWAIGDFRAGDDQLTAAESSLETDPGDRADAEGRRPCPHPKLFHCYVLEPKPPKKKAEPPMAGKNGGESAKEKVDDSVPLPQHLSAEQ